jgi:hypothetical protein
MTLRMFYGGFVDSGIDGSTGHEHVSDAVGAGDAALYAAKRDFQNRSRLAVVWSVPE